jgi:hypothetical protein
MRGIKAEWGSVHGMSDNGCREGSQYKRIMGEGREWETASRNRWENAEPAGRVRY